MEKDKTDSSQPGVNEVGEGSLSGDKVAIRVLTVRPLSLEDMDLVEPSDVPHPSVPATGSKDQLEALKVASTSQGVSGVERMPPGSASSSTTSGSQRAMKTACSSALSSPTKLPISVITAVLQLINHDRLTDLLLDLDASRDVPGAQTCSTSAAGLLAQEMLTKVSALLQADAESQAALSRQSGTPSPDLQVEDKAGLGSVAAEVIVAVIGNVLAARAAIQEEAQGPVTFSSVGYFLSAVCADVQTLPLRTSRSSSPSSGRSLGELLTTMSRTKVVQAVDLKLEEHFGPCRNEGLSTSPSSLSLTEGLVMIPYLGSGRSEHSLAGDLVDEIIVSVKSAVELLERSTSSSSRAGNSSSITEYYARDVSSVAKKMVCKAAAKLTPLVSSSRMGDVTAHESVSCKKETCLKSLAPSLIRLLLVRSVDTVTAACRAISSEFCFRESAKNQGLTKLQELANEQMLACLNQSVEEVQIDELIEGVSAVLDNSLVLRRPEMSFSHIYRSLFVDSLLTGSGQRSTEVLDTLIFQRPVHSWTEPGS